MAWGESLHDILLPPHTPTLNQVSAHRKEAQSLGSFLDWLREHDKYGADMAELPGTEKVLYEYLEIDVAKAEEERRELLAYQRLIHAHTEIRKELGLDEDDEDEEDEG